jgi:hypothetical protein
VADHHEAESQAFAVVGRDEGGAVPSFWETAPEDVAGEDCSVALILPEIIVAEIGEQERRGDRENDENGPVAC